MPATTTTTMLSGAALLTGLAHDATDGLPIVNQVLAVAARIVGLAEQIDKSREDLRALADRARKMEATLVAVVGDRELGEDMLRRLEAMNDVMYAIERQFTSIIKRGRVRNTLRYILTVRKEVESLKGEFDDRLKELEIAANMDTNIIARADSRFIGEFRNIRHCEINLLRRISTQTRSLDGHTLNCYLATFDGSNEVFVVRDIVMSDRDEDERRRIDAHNRILERMSLIQNRHAVISCLYGRNMGPSENRFVVLKAGDVLPLADVLSGRTAEISFLGRIVARLADAAYHLHKHGAAWDPARGLGATSIYLDNDYEPKIGIHDDLVPMSDYPPCEAGAVMTTLRAILDLSSPSVLSQSDQFPHESAKTTAWCTPLLGELIEAGYCTRCDVLSVRRPDLSSLIPLSPEPRVYLRLSDGHYGHITPPSGNLLLSLATGSRCQPGSLLHAKYEARPFDPHDYLL